MMEFYMIEREEGEEREEGVERNVSERAGETELM